MEKVTSFFVDFSKDKNTDIADILNMPFNANLLWHKYKKID